jgi:predicted outer membrane repeat protein
VVTAVAVGHGVSTIEGFTIRNGNADFGGGVYCSNASPTIANNTITDNSASSAGGGICCSCACPTIANNTIMGNAASSLGGGGIYCDSSSPLISSNAITGNSASYGGGGIYCVGDASPMIVSNTIAGNNASSSGGGMYCGSWHLTVANNTIVGNRASSSGGGIYCDGRSLTIANNTIMGNRASSSGAGIYCDFWSSTTIANTIVAYNASGIYRYSDPLTTVLLVHSCAYGNTAYNFSGLTDPTGTDGNISADLDSDGDTTEPLPLDLAGKVRFAEDPAAPDTGSGTPPIVDMGAYEYVRPGDVNGDGYVDVADLLFLVRSWGKSASQPGFDSRCDFDLDGRVSILDLLLLVNHWAT